MPSKQPKKKRPGKKPDTRATSERMQAMINAYAATCNLVKAAKKAGIDRSTHYQWLDTKPRYADAFNKTKRAAVDYLESKAVQRSAVGWLEPIHYQGSVCGHVRRYDGGTLQFLLRGMAPEKYGHRTEISGPGGRPVEIRIAERIAAANKRLIEMRKNDASSVG